MPPVFSMPQQPPYPYYGSAAGYWEHHLAGKIDNTKTGLLLLIIGLALSWIPFIGAIGGLVALIGALLVILGREAFGREHARNTILALVFFFLGIIPALLYAAAYYLARQRIVRREIPSPITPQPFMAPYGGIPPTSGSG